MMTSTPTGEALGPSQRERKFLLDAAAARMVLAVASKHLRPEHDEPTRRVSFVRTTYFDTLDLAYYRSSFGPIAHRLRVREYAPPQSHGFPVVFDSCYLEIKRTAGGLRAKSRLPLTVDQVAPHLAILAGGPFHPCVSTWYRRTAFTDGHDQVRVTMDNGLCYSAPVPIGARCPGIEPPHVLARGPEYVLEVKLWRDPPPWLADALSGLREAVGFSKFMAGMRAAETWAQRRASFEPACHTADLRIAL